MMDMGNTFLFPDYSQHPYRHEYLSFASPNVRRPTNLSVTHFAKLIQPNIILYEKLIFAKLVKNFFFFAPVMSPVSNLS